MTVIRVRGRALPSGEPIDLYSAADRWRTEPVPGAELVAEGWVPFTSAPHPAVPASG